MHVPVLTEEVVHGLDIKTDDVVLDGTLGGGGHSQAICARLGTKGMFIGIDADIAAVERTQKLLRGCACQVKLEQSNFRYLDRIIGQHNVSHVSKVLFDLGISSFQIDAPVEGEEGRGFSFQRNEPLVMTFEQQPGDRLTAGQLLAVGDEEQLTTIISRYGEEKYARRIARAIVTDREQKPIEMTQDLVRIIREATPALYHRARSHFATKTFQALRMAVNDELGALEEGLEKGFKALASGGRMAVISFHSLEDRIVKNFFRDQEKSGLGTRITKKPIVPSQEEVLRNPRSRSAKLRIFEKNEALQ
ncbi:MAG: 16S rRNA (cytosine1402-N4)-methyltransferase [Parcubacteria group bacterium Gr01-1014_48]|nr:MAG: 16S rRNA (cytosine1402-N4)-methyltransferase [Parcubacteria group bacterium Greene0416_14]TSC73719.1 MAG: 16S rRNA (cytosine1402-N4)-methyltransferase [Parcubacteria group bacterium Gr01-1014_48]TSD00999.1 MAG: 16S rRNA (cytosine1402-N4)-methyltransferase [Parcubacteria group bacterium Greene1014_15]TSD08106.1 MAG: 16S rRNA (cytosine1402-N4)-methyltransferase [Parcubacteria group bacterium Greene0714_4]